MVNLFRRERRWLIVFSLIYFQQIVNLVYGCIVKLIGGYYLVLTKPTLIKWMWLKKSLVEWPQQNNNNKAHVDNQKVAALTVLLLVLAFCQPYYRWKQYFNWPDKNFPKNFKIIKITLWSKILHPQWTWP